jgi:hypothetical protein
MRCAKRWLRRKAGYERRYADPTYPEHEDDSSNSEFRSNKPCASV